MSEKIRAAIMGGSECGKTTLARFLAARHWQRDRLASIVFDPWKREHRWGNYCWVTSDLKRFESAVWGAKKPYAIVWDESTSTLNRDAEKIQFFTAIRHKHPAFYVLGHHYTALLPVMRDSLTEVYLFRQAQASAEKWADQLADREVIQSVDLAQYEFLHKRAFRPISRRRLNAAELKTLP